MIGAGETLGSPDQEALDSGSLLIKLDTLRLDVRSLNASITALDARIQGDLGWLLALRQTDPNTLV